MKFRPVPKSDLFVSEVALAVPAPASSRVDAVTAERWIRQAFDHGVNFFRAGLQSSFPADLRNRSVLALSVEEPGDGSPFRLPRICEDALRSLGTDRIDLLVLGSATRPLPSLRNVDALLALQKEGKVRAVGIAANALHQDELCNLDQLGVSLLLTNVEDAVEAADRRAWNVFEHGGDHLAFAPMFPAGEMSAPFDFLSTGTGRTSQQASLLYALSRPWVAAVFPAVASDEQLMDVLAAPLAPALTDDEIRAADAASEVVFRARPRRFPSLEELSVLPAPQPV